MTDLCHHYKRKPYAVTARAPGQDGLALTVLEVIVTFCDHRCSKLKEQDATDTIGALLTCCGARQACELAEIDRDWVEPKAEDGARIDSADPGMPGPRQ
jgi:hypothetical protein